MYLRWQPLFPGHVFVALDPDRDIPRLLEIDGVDDVVRPGGRPTPIAGATVAAIRLAERRGLFDADTACRCPESKVNRHLRFSVLGLSRCW